MAAYPGSLATFTGFTSSHTLAADSHASQHNLEQAEIIATQTKIGTGSSTPTSGMLLRGNGVGTSAWAQVGLTTDVTGVLPVANGGNGTTNTTGTGSAVFSVAPALTGGGSWTGSPSFTTPTIADFTNSTHTHANNAGGGTLNAANAIQANTISANNISSSAITLGYVQTTSNFVTANTSATQVTGVTLTVTIPSGSRYIKITGYVAAFTNTGAGVGTLTIWDGVVGAGTQLGQFNMASNASAPNEGGVVMAVVQPAAGSKTYNLGFHVAGGTGTLNNAATNPTFLLVEAI